MRHTRILAPVALAAALALVSTGCSGGSGGGDASAAPEAGDVGVINDIFGPGGTEAGEGLTIPVGELMAITGEGSFYGEVMSQGAALAAAQIEAAGGPKFELTVADHQSGNVQQATQEFQRMRTQEGIDIMLISYANIGDALAPLISENEVLAIQGGGTSPGQLGKDYLWANKMVSGTSQIAGELAWLAQTYPDAKKLAIEGTTDQYQYSYQELVPEIWPLVQPGGTVVATEIHPGLQTDYSQTIAKLKAADPDIIWNGDAGNDTGYFVKQAVQAGLDVPIMGQDYTDQACQIAGAAFANYIYAVDAYDPAAGPWAEYFAQTYEEEFGEESELFSANYYEAMFILWDLVKQAIAAGEDPQDPAVLQDILTSTDSFPSLYGGAGEEVGSMSPDLEQHIFNKPMGVFTMDEQCQATKVYDIQAIPDGADPTTALVGPAE